jgi:hypothetical protein
MLTLRDIKDLKTLEQEQQSASKSKTRRKSENESETISVSRFELEIKRKKHGLLKNSSTCSLLVHIVMYLTFGLSSPLLGIYIYLSILHMYYH